jgi:hypothetical protein
MGADVKRLAILLLCALPVHANLPRAMATCSAGQCVISEADWLAFKDFHKRTREVVDQIDAQTERLNNEVERTRIQLARCEARLSKWNS